MEITGYGIVNLSLSDCPRCGGVGHDELQFRPLENPMQAGPLTLTHWTLCPTNEEPILLTMAAAPPGPTVVQPAPLPPPADLFAAPEGTPPVG